MRSMTGFGRADFQVDGVGFEVEARSVNHRYLDVKVRLPRSLAAFEPDVRARAQERFARGKVDVVVALPDAGAPTPALELDLELARQYARGARELCEGGDVAGPLGVGDLLSLPGVARFAEPRFDAESHRQALVDGADAALSALDAMRVAEGATIERELLGRVDTLVRLADAMEGRVGEVQRAVRERLRKRAEHLQRETGLLDEARLHQEVVIAADRMDVTEELVRLRSHADQFRSIAASAAADRPVGRRLDFLCQELGREANTLGSKAGDASLAHQIVDLKAEIERMREQVQNVE